MKSLSEFDFKQFFHECELVFSFILDKTTGTTKSQLVRIDGQTSVNLKFGFHKKRVDAFALVRFEVIIWFKLSFLLIYNALNTIVEPEKSISFFQFSAIKLTHHFDCSLGFILGYLYLNLKGD